MKSGTNEIHGSAYYYGAQPRLERGDQPHQPDSTATTRTGTPAARSACRSSRTSCSCSRSSRRSRTTRATSRRPTRCRRRSSGRATSRSPTTPTARCASSTTRSPPASSNGASCATRSRATRSPPTGWDPLAQMMLTSLWLPNNAGDDLTGLNNFKYEQELQVPLLQLLEPARLEHQRPLEDLARVSFFRRTRTRPTTPNGIDPLKMRRTEGSQAQRLEHRGRHGLHASPTTSLTSAARTTRPTTSASTPRWTVGEEGYAPACGPTSGDTPNLEDRPLLYFPNRPDVRAATRSACGTSGTSSRSATASARSSPSTWASHSVKAGIDVRFKRGSAARYNNAQLHVQLQQDTANTASGGSTSRPAIPWASFLLGAHGPRRHDVAVTPDAGFQHRDVRGLRPGRLPRHREPHAQPRPALRVRGRLLGSAEPAAAAARPDRSDPRACRPPSTRTRHSPRAVRARRSARSWRNRPGRSRYVYNGAFYFTEEGNKRATKSYALQFMPRVGAAYRIRRQHRRCAPATRASTRRARPPTSGNEPLGRSIWRAFSPTTTALPR